MQRNAMGMSRAALGFLVLLLAARSSVAGPTTYLAFHVWRRLERRGD